jgi:hypothetical protein
MRAPRHVTPEGVLNDAFGAQSEPSGECFVEQMFETTIPPDAESSGVRGGCILSTGRWRGPQMEMMIAKPTDSAIAVPNLVKSRPDCKRIL